MVRGRSQAKRPVTKKTCLAKEMAWLGGNPKRIEAVHEKDLIWKEDDMARWLGRDLKQDVSWKGDDMERWLRRTPRDESSQALSIETDPLPLKKKSLTSAFQSINGPVCQKIAA